MGLTPKEIHSIVYEFNKYEIIELVKEIYNLKLVKIKDSNCLTWFCILKDSELVTYDNNQETILRKFKELENE